MSQPMSRRYLEDYVAGSEQDAGEAAVGEDEVRAFAARYDPQPFHLDPDAARVGPYGGLIASGWHTASIVMRLMVDAVIDGETSMGSPGVGPIRWIRPVRPGDTLRVRVRIVSSRRSESKPDRGVIVLEVDVRNQHGELVMTVEDWRAIVRARTRGDARLSGGLRAD